MQLDKLISSHVKAFTSIKRSPVTEQNKNGRLISVLSISVFENICSSSEVNISFTPAFPEGDFGSTDSSYSQTVDLIAGE
jgi:hypothetical protein